MRQAIFRTNDGQFIDAYMRHLSSIVKETLIYLHFGQLHNIEIAAWTRTWYPVYSM